MYLDNIAPKFPWVGVDFYAQNIYLSLPLSWSEGSVSKRRGDVGDTAIT